MLRLLLSLGKVCKIWREGGREEKDPKLSRELNQHILTFLHPPFFFNVEGGHILSIAGDALKYHKP